MAQGHFEEAKTLFEQGHKALEKQEPSRWGVWNKFRLGEVYDILGEREKAKAQCEYGLTFKDKWGFDEAAKALLKYPYSLPENGDVGPLPPL